MKRETSVILAALGVSPAVASAQEIVQVEHRIEVLNPSTVLIVQRLLQSGAMYASQDATQLRIKASVLNDEMYAGIASSEQVNIDGASGDFVVDSAFASALAKSTLLNESMPQTVQDYLLLESLKKKSSSDLKIELANFRSNPFFSN